MNCLEMTACRIRNPIALGAIFFLALLLGACERLSTGPDGPPPPKRPKPLIETVDGKKRYRDPGEKLTFFVPDSFQVVALDTNLVTEDDSTRFDLLLIWDKEAPAFPPRVNVLSVPRTPGSSDNMRDLQEGIEAAVAEGFEEFQVQKNAVERFGNRDGLVLEYTARVEAERLKFRQVIAFTPNLEIYVTQVDSVGSFDFNQPFEDLYTSLRFE